MSENTNLPSESSVAAQLHAAGFHRTGIIRAVVELVGSYLGHPDIQPHLADALQGTRNDAMNIVTQSAVNDDQFGQKKNGTSA